MSQAKSFGIDEALKSARAAQYVRMSTDHQKYSIENQAAAIAAYATQRDLKIVRTYADHGRSGVRLDGREDLQRLIRDVKSGEADFNVILVFRLGSGHRFVDIILVLSFRQIGIPLG